MNKKGVIWEDIADIFLGGVIIMIAMTGYFLVSNFSEFNLKDRVEEKTNEILYEDVYVMYLNSKVDDKLTLSQAIIISKITNDKEFLEEKLDDLLTDIYFDSVCWEFYIDDDKWTNKNKCRTDTELLDSEALVPLPNNEAINTRLLVKGYAK